MEEKDGEKVENGNVVPLNLCICVCVGEHLRRRDAVTNIRCHNSNISRDRSQAKGSVTILVMTPADASSAPRRRRSVLPNKSQAVAEGHLWCGSFSLLR